ncbi:MAG TPA: 3-hydroxyacyl-CoA dehydrogenase NAD-binding domain-containing protein [Usitatibacter sp.]|jgi:3-hydroxyacyl-CoA dehydrogenase|nr:3-hydroxyacyl-CoA dehydrogenase NAD-binding domain-containing protein [Usitatibacter sp.]
MSAPYSVRAPVAVITLDNPPVNGLGHDTRVAIAAGLGLAAADPAVTAIVITGANGLFSGGADIREFGTPRALAQPTLRDLIDTIEASPKPVTAAIEGTCMGGGLELALACHYRVAAPGTRFALPEVKLGLIPGAGGTQRLPRVVGIHRALDMIVSGEPVPVEKLVETRLADRVIAGDLVAGAVRFAQEMANRHKVHELVREIALSPPGDSGFFGAAREKATAASKYLPAPQRCIDAVEAATTKPFDEGVRYERSLFTALMQSPESRALRHAFFGERAAARIPDVPADTPARRIEKVAVIGAGTMGGGIAMTFLNAGLPVTLLETTREALDRGLATIRRNYEGAVKRGKLAPDKLEQRMALLTPTLSQDAIRDADLVVEAVFEDMSVKEGVFRQLDAVMKPGAVLATNTSTLDVNRIAAATRRPADVVGMHYFSPANVMRLLEVVRAESTAKDVLATVMQVAKKTGKTAVVSRVCDGFIGNRMLAQYYNQAWFLLEEGATPQQVDRALEDFGMAMGPLRVGDLAGNDIGWAVRKRRYVERPEMVISRIADRLCEMGRFGQKTGAGWYRYDAGSREPIPDPEVEAMIAKYRQELGIKPRAIPSEEIVERCIYALVNEGARILEEGIAQRASDVDMVYLTGYGFPRHRGGPLFHADTVGLPDVVESMAKFAANSHGDPAFWKPAPLLARLAEEGKGFN